MKKHYFVLAVALLGFSVLHAQTSFGIKAGVNRSGLRGDMVQSLTDVLDYTNGIVKPTNITGFHAGAFVNLPLSEVFFVEPGVFYSQKGYGIKANLDMKGLNFLGINASADLKTNYIEIPVNLKAVLGPIELSAGPYVAYLLDASLRAKAGALGFNVINEKWDATHLIARWDGGLKAGVGLKMQNGLSITANYSHGLARIDASNRLNSYNNGFGLSLGYAF